MNGKKKAFCSGFVVAFLLCGVFGGLVVEQGLGSVGDTGYFGEKDDNTAAAVAADGYLGSVFYLPVRANITGLAAYYKCNSGDDGWRVAIYSVDGQTCYYGSVGDEGTKEEYIWHNWTSSSSYVTLDSGYYLLVMRTSTGGAYYNLSSGGNGISYSVVWAETNPALILTYTSYEWNIYANYTEVAEEVDNTLSASMGVSSWGGLAVSVFLIAVCLVLALKSRSWAVNFLFGLGTVGFLGWVFANATVEVYGGWLMYMVLLSAVLALTKGAVLVRASGV